MMSLVIVILLTGYRNIEIYNRTLLHAHIMTLHNAILGKHITLVLIIILYTKKLPMAHTLPNKISPTMQGCVEEVYSVD